jgi:hypothetical protein
MYKSVPQDQFQAIFDGLAPESAPFTTVGPQIHIFHPIFDMFVSRMNDQDLQVNGQDKENVANLMRAMSIIHKDESAYSGDVNPILGDILAYELESVANVDSKVEADSVITDEGAMLLIEELKNSLGSGNDPSTQVVISMRHYWIDSSVSSRLILLISIPDYFQRRTRYATNAVAIHLLSQRQAHGYV